MWEEGEGDGAEAVVRFETSDAGSTPSFALDDHGETPLPPYTFDAAPRPEDRTRYQSVFATPGSVRAALPPLPLVSILRAPIARRFPSSTASHPRVVCTSPPARSNPSRRRSWRAQHAREERFTVLADELESLAETMDANGPIQPVGTTAARVLEPVYWLAYRSGFLLVDKSGRIPPSDTHSSSLPDVSDSSSSLPFELGHLDQWAASIWPYSPPPGAKSPLAASLVRLRRLCVHAGMTQSAAPLLCIAPGYDFACDGLLTNFHAPDSTLMMLVSAMVGGPESEHAAKQR